MRGDVVGARTVDHSMTVRIQNKKGFKIKNYHNFLIINRGLYMDFANFSSMRLWVRAIYRIGFIFILLDLIWW